MGKRPGWLLPEGAPTFRKQVFVPKTPEDAFRLFTEGIDLWWPLATHSLLGARAVRCEMECREGGTVFEVDDDGRRHQWGTVELWQPPSLLRLSWQHGAMNGLGEKVEVRFLPDAGGSIVSLETVLSEAAKSPTEQGKRTSQPGTEESRPDEVDCASPDPPSEQGADAPTGESGFDALLSEAARLESSGDRRRALTLLRRSYRGALARLEYDKAHRVLICRCAITISAGRPGRVLEYLRDLLERTLSAENRVRVCYQLSRCYELAGEVRKARFYSELALIGARALDDQISVAFCLNQRGNALLAEGDPHAALECYVEATELLPGNQTAPIAQVQCNRGYSLLLLDRPKEAVAFLTRSLAFWRRQDNPQSEVLPRLDLAQAYLTLGRSGRSAMHARRALSLARQLEDRDSLRRALFLLGELGTAAGDEAVAAQCCRELRSRFRELADVLPRNTIPSGFNETINWRA